MKRVAAGAHLPTLWLFEPTKRPDDRADYCLELCSSRTHQDFSSRTHSEYYGKPSFLLPVQVRGHGACAAPRDASKYASTPGNLGTGAYPSCCSSPSPPYAAPDTCHKCPSDASTDESTPRTRTWAVGKASVRSSRVSE